MFIVPKIYGNQLAMTHCHLVIKKLKGLNYLSKKKKLKDIKKNGKKFDGPTVAQEQKQTRM